MRKLFSKNLVLLLLFGLTLVFSSKFLVGDNNKENGSNIRSIVPPKNIIVMISDGMGFNHVVATDYYQTGSLNSQQYESFTIKYGMSHYPAKVGGYPGALQWNQGYNTKLMWTNFGYAMNDFTESAAAGTALATGFKTYNNSIGMDVNYLPLVNLTQIAKSLNKSTGVISSVQFSHATPASFVAHNLTRNNYSQIAFEMLFGSKLDVIMGTGNPDFDNDGNVSHKTYKYIGDSLGWLGLQAGNSVFYVNNVADTVEDCNGDGVRDPWTLIQTRSQFQSLASGSTPLRILGVPRIHETLQQTRSGDGNAVPFSVPLVSTVPTLVEMTNASLNVLDNNSNGFFLMIEGGAIDWASHANQKGRMIEEQIDFNNSVNAVINWVNSHSNWNETMLIITGDHETGMLWGSGSGNPATYNPIVNNGINNVPGMSWYSGEHTNSLIPFYAMGTGANVYKLFADEVDSVRGKYINNTEVAQGIKALWENEYVVNSVVLSGVELPKEFSVDQNYPNPFNPTTAISINMKRAGTVKVNVYDISGRVVKTLMNNEKLGAGVKSIKMNGSELSSGVYFYNLVVDGVQIDSKRMTLIK
ncbi:MAG: alkaline phosphatase [Candidatus Kapaibacterium sp.]